MRHLYIIGNGFDLAHGLETSYKQFITWYLNNIKTHIMDKHSREPYEYNDGIIYMKMSHTYMTGVAQSIEPKEPAEYLNWIEKYSKNISVFSYKLSPLLRSIVSKNGWADIEKTYYKSLINIHSKNIPSHSFEGEIFKYTVESLNDSFDALKKKLLEYLREIVFPNIQIQPKRPPLEMCLLYDNAKRLINEDQLYLNFNYTNTLDKYLGIQKSQVISIHGSILDPENPIIFGYGDEMDKKYKELEDEDDKIYLEHMKSFGYFKTEEYSKMIDFMDAGDYYVHVIGHSLGLSDRVLLNRVFEHEHCKKIELHYYKFDGGDNFKESTMNLSRHFNDKSSMRDKVVNYRKTYPMT